MGSLGLTNIYNSFPCSILTPQLCLEYAKILLRILLYDPKWCINFDETNFSLSISLCDKWEKISNGFMPTKGNFHLLSSGDACTTLNYQSAHHWVNSEWGPMHSRTWSMVHTPSKPALDYKPLLNSNHT